MFRIDRVKAADVLDVDATVPEGFDPGAYARGFRERPGQPTATFDISPDVARWFEEYYPVRRAEDRPDGWRRIEISYGRPQWVATLILSLGSGVRAVGPEAVSDAVRKLGTEIASVYA